MNLLLFQANALKTKRMKYENERSNKTQNWCRTADYYGCFCVWFIPSVHMFLSDGHRLAIIKEADNFV